MVVNYMTLWKKTQLTKIQKKKINYRALRKVGYKTFRK